MGQSMRQRIRHAKSDAELDITSFMNLMIVLVPVLLLSMVFSHITVLEINLPPETQKALEDNPQNRQLELIIRSNEIRMNYPAGVLLKTFPVQAGENGRPDYDFAALSEYLQQLKQTLANKSIEKRDIVILSEPKTDYQTIVNIMDTVRSYKAVVAASVVNAELFPDISLGDAPDPGRDKTAAGASSP